MQDSQIYQFLAQLGQWNWLILAGILFTFEFLMPGFYLFFLGLAAVLTGVIAFAVDLPWQGQIFIYVALSIICTFAARLFWNPHASSDEPHLNKRGQQYVGNQYTLVTDLENGRGKVKVGDTLWLVSGPELPSGAKVKVVDADDSTLIVEKA